MPACRRPIKGLIWNGKSRFWSFNVPSKVGASIARDVVDIITVFSARLYGWRSPKNQTLLDGIAKAVDAGETA
jgi:hypothetical protein